LKVKNESSQSQGKFFEEKYRGYLFQSIIFGDIKQWWRNPSCRIKPLNVNEWPLLPPLFASGEWDTVQEQEICTN